MPTLNIGGQRVKVGDGFMSLSPDEQNATVEEIAKSLGGQMPVEKAPIQAEPGPQPSVAEDLAKSGASGLARGAADLVGLPGTLGGLAESGLDWVKAKGYEAVTGEKPEPGSFFAQEVLPNPLDGESLKRGLSTVTGGATDYQPKTTAGEYARTVGEFAPSALAGPGGIIRKAAMTSVPAVVSETAGQATEGTAAEPWARLGGAIIGGGLTAGGKPNVVKQAAKGAPSQETLKTVTDNAYKTLRDVGIQYHPGAYAQAVHNMATDLQKAGLRQPVAKQAHEMLASLTDDIGKAPDFDDINSLVSSLSETARGLRATPNGQQEAKAIEMLRDRLMQLEENAPITSRIPLDRGRLNEVRTKVKEVAFRNIKERALNEIVANADTYAAGTEAGIRNGINNLLRSKRGQQMFKGEERKALLEVAHGRKALRTLSRFGFDIFKVSGNAAALPFVGAAATATGVGPLAAGALATAGTAAKIASPFFTGKALDQAKAAIRSGKLRDNSTLNAASAERIKANIRRLLAAEAGAQAAQPSAPGT